MLREIVIKPSFTLNRFSQSAVYVTGKIFKRDFSDLCKASKVVTLHDGHNVIKDYEEITPYKKRRSFNIKTPRAVKRIRNLINFMYEQRSKTSQFFFVTITTKQHETGKSDRELYNRIGLWFKNRKELDYVCTVERQTTTYSVISKPWFWVESNRVWYGQYTGLQPTEDLHFHCVICKRDGKIFNINRELRKLGKLLGTKNHPALFDVKRVSDPKRLAFYISKYITKQGNQSSLFWCRTWSASKALRTSYKELSHLYEQKFSGNDVQGYVNEIGRISRVTGRDLLIEAKAPNGDPLSPYFGIYKWNQELYNIAIRFKSESLNLERVEINDTIKT